MQYIVDFWTWFLFPRTSLINSTRVGITIGHPNSALPIQPHMYPISLNGAVLPAEVHTFAAIEEHILCYMNIFYVIWTYFMNIFYVILIITKWKDLKNLPSNPLTLSCTAILKRRTWPRTMLGFLWNPSNLDTILYDWTVLTMDLKKNTRKGTTNNSIAMNWTIGVIFASFFFFSLFYFF